MKQQTMTPSELRSHVTEKEFMAHVIRLAQMYGWMSFHAHDSRHSAPGFPDLVLLKPTTEKHSGRLVFIELKTERGKLTPEQASWLNALKMAGQEVYVWRPKDWQLIEATLRRRENH